MNLKHLGETIDIHGGGKDLIFPHHENEIAQSEALTKKQFVRYWMHVGFVTVNGEKMAKSKGNFVTIFDAIKKVKNPEVLRVFAMRAHYRSDLDYNEDALKESKEILDKLYRALEVEEEEKEVEKEVIKLKNEIINALADDLNLNVALSNYIQLASFILQKEKISKESKKIYFEIGSKIFGLFKYLPKKEINQEFIEEILKIREELRKKGLYEISDKIRKAFELINIEVYDTPKGYKWRFKI